MKRFFVFQEDNSQKFWAIELSGSESIVHFGRLGTAGQSSKKSFASSEKCEKEAQKLIAEKLKKGYTETDEQGMKSTKSERMGKKDIQSALRKSATVFETGGFFPTKKLLESWIGRVGFCLPKEETPKDKGGKPMFPAAMFFLKELPFVPAPLNGIEMLSVYISENIYDHLVNEDYDGYYAIREYKSCNDLVPCELTSKEIKPMPLKPKFIKNDYPAWDSEDIADEIQDEICRLEDEKGMEYHEDIAEEMYCQHKIGGYGSYCQPAYGYAADGFEFVFQIASDDEADFNIVDGGNFYFYKNPTTKKWKIHCDFY
jgi:predicted DNA-binding WGR domain protein/uncharacterized protein YwqG